MKTCRVFVEISLFSLLTIYLSFAQSPITGSGTSQYVPKYTDSTKIGNSIIYVSGTDNVGVGTTTPGATVDVNGSLKSNSLTIGTTVASNYPARIVGSSTAQGFPLLYLSESTPATTGVTYCLSAVHSGGAASGRTAYGISATSTGNFPSGGKNIGGAFNASGNTTNYSIQIGGPSAGANNYAIYSASSAQSYFAGNIGIGTASPDTFKLKANGTIKAKEVVVEVIDWPDYVFEDGYTLQPLEELEKEVRTTKRLPGIPSAAEIGARGLHVAEMQAKMMKKIEELTLYVIEIKKDNALLHARVSKLSH